MLLNYIHKGIVLQLINLSRKYLTIYLSQKEIVMKITKQVFQQHGDERGMLVAIEKHKDIPFEVKRIYYLYNTKTDARRGFHAHKNLEQILVCISGSCKILLDDGYDRKTINLENPFEGLHVSNNMWREMYEFTEGAVLMVLASEYYDEDDYIRDYSEFLEFVEESKNGSEI